MTLVFSPLNGKLGLIKALDACLFEVLSVIRMNRVEPGSTESVRGSLVGKSTPGRTLFVHEAIGGRDPEKIGLQSFVYLSSIACCVQWP